MTAFETVERLVGILDAIPRKTGAQDAPDRVKALDRARKALSEMEANQDTMRELEWAHRETGRCPAPVVSLQVPTKPPLMGSVALWPFGKTKTKFTAPDQVIETEERLFFDFGLLGRIRESQVELDGLRQGLEEILAALRARDGHVRQVRVPHLLPGEMTVQSAAKKHGIPKSTLSGRLVRPGAKPPRPGVIAARKDESTGVCIVRDADVKRLLPALRKAQKHGRRRR